MNQVECLLVAVVVLVLVVLLFIGHRLNRANLLVDCPCVRCGLGPAQSGLHAHQCEQSDLGPMVHVLGHRVCWFDRPMHLRQTDALVSHSLLKPEALRLQMPELAQADSLCDSDSRCGVDKHPWTERLLVVHRQPNPSEAAFTIE